MMRPEAESLRKQLEQASDEHSHGGNESALADLFKSTPADEAAALLAEACAGLSHQAIGYQILPSLRPLLQDEDIFRSLCSVVSDARAEEPFRNALLDSLDGAVRRGGQDKDRKSYWQLLRGIANDPEQTVTLRVRALRALARDNSPATRDAVRDALADKDPNLVGAAAHSVRIWHRYGKLFPAESASLLQGYAERAPRQALKNSSILLAIAELEGSGSETIRKLASHADTDLERARLLNSAGDALDDDTFGAIVQRSVDEADSISGAILVAQESNGKGRLAKLTQANHSGAATLLAKEINRPPSSALTSAQKTDQPDTGVASFGQSVRSGFNAGFHKGDALYRDLINHPIWNQHWHAAMYLGFDYFQNSGQGRMLLINASDLFGDTINYFSAERSFSSPDTNVADRMAELREAFMVAFREGKGEDILYHGARTVEGITPAQRNAVVSTAHALFAKDIAYTFEDMLDYEWWDWSGYISDIDETRCDGVVEYSYERNGLRVCTGEKDSLWNISTPGTEHVENHNDLHNHDYNKGELCPRIQAGNHGHGTDTRFVASSVEAPHVEVFSVLADANSPGPVIRFRVQAPHYFGIYVRLIVKKDNGSWFFLRGDTDWIFPCVATNTDWTVNWRGKTVNGPDFGGQNGNYTFRFVAVDPGGNVSGTFEINQTINWPRLVRIDTINYDPPYLDQYGEYVVIRNSGTAAQNLTGWMLRDIANHLYKFPAFTLAAGAAVRVWTGIGTNDSVNLYWGRSQAVWNNTGDTATLIDSAGTLVSQYTYAGKKLINT